MHETSIDLLCDFYSFNYHSYVHRFLAAEKDIQQFLNRISLTTRWPLQTCPYTHERRNSKGSVLKENLLSLHMERI